MKKSALSIFICSLLLVASFPITGFCSYPEPTDDYVNDFAQVLSGPDRDQISELFKRLEEQTGIEAVVVTVQSLEEYGTGDREIESFATNLFNEWGIGHEKKNNGILILLAVEERSCRIELGKGYGRQYDPVMKDIIDMSMLPYFREGEYSRGLFEGARGVVEKVTEKVSWFSYYKWHVIIGVLIIVCIFAGVSCMKSGKKGWGWAFFAAAGVLIFFLLRMMMTANKAKSGFGGGKSFGGGASGRW